MIVECIHVPQVASRQIGVQAGLAHNLLECYLEVVVAATRLPAVLREDVQKVSQVVSLLDVAFADFVSVHLKHVFVPQPHAVAVVKKSHLLIGCEIDIKVALGVVKKKL
eukprot:CAMPEP_0185587678 /NCGR_PEP_ID=MMETSP0434-20130131/50046_1 /TAXON_ID=626734 ORGANISM="Favella taraikaensis, Strain Fe Narragansett Bay" /NCGR_SAMPLE_ID=MMETSP0434 /ASSEMBLY_ACC=CAM_ASM_000379 /LENGTH=108 /DNA_ID=CAMNT_0028209749 /DNA_START=1070 /DNA_END=1396 /DNA_ORIENTATION=-